MSPGRAGDEMPSVQSRLLQARSEPFVMNTHEEVLTVFAEYLAGRLGQITAPHIAHGDVDNQKLKS